MIKSKYIVYVDDNFHYMDESERYCAGAFDTAEEAISICKQIVERSLGESLQNTKTADELVQSYKMYGEDPWISCQDGSAKFSAWNYAEVRSKEIFQASNNTEGSER